jgi:hypothetical protein
LEQKALDRISARVAEVLGEQGYTTVQEGKAESNRPSIFRGETTAYAVIYAKKEKRFELRQTTVENGKIGEEWKSVSVWLFDPDAATMQDAESIANDFCDSLSVVIRKKQVAKARKKEKGEDRYVDPVFLMNRFTKIFPDMRFAIQAHKDKYGVVVPHAMTKEFLNPMIAQLLREGDSQQISRLLDVLSQNYKNGDLDTKSLITLGILNAITDPEQERMVEEGLEEEARKAWQHARKYRNKKVKPERVKALEKLSAEKSTGSLR